MKNVRWPNWLKTVTERIWNSRISLLGVAMTTVSAVIMVASLIMDLSAQSSTYRGLIAYAVMPMFFVAGLLLIPFGVWRVYRRSLKSGQSPQPWVIDFSQRDHRRRLFFFFGLTALNLLILSVILYEGYQYTDSNAFCGTLCHRVMNPQYTAYQQSPHARVQCVHCHIGGGASWYVKSKLSGLRQVWAVLKGDYSRPIPSPVENLRPARETCEECHWPQMFHGSRVVVKRLAGATEEEDQISAIKLHIGGMNERTSRYEGIHWHVSADNRIEYLASDRQRLAIRQVRMTRGQERRLFVRPGDPEVRSEAEGWRTMDCVDCHNRPSHSFRRADDEVDRAIISGQLPRLLGLRDEAIALLTRNYGDEAKVEAEMQANLMSHFPSRSSEQIAQIAHTLKDLRDDQVFPEMRIVFGSYPSHLGHRDDPWGCFRCHDNQLADQGRSISQECELCHQLMVVEEPLSSLSEEIKTQLELD